jgi:hypothetical protein
VAGPPRCPPRPGRQKNGPVRPLGAPTKTKILTRKLPSSASASCPHSRAGPGFCLSLDLRPGCTRRPYVSPYLPPCNLAVFVSVLCLVSGFASPRPPPCARCQPFYLLTALLAVVGEPQVPTQRGSFRVPTASQTEAPPSDVVMARLHARLPWGHAFFAASLRSSATAAAPCARPAALSYFPQTARPHEVPFGH